MDLQEGESGKIRDGKIFFPKNKTDFMAKVIKVQKMGIKWNYFLFTS
jgi:hypothetical protein